MRSLFKILLFISSIVLTACMDMDELTLVDDADLHTAIIRFDARIEGYDVQTRAATSMWPDGARIYIRYQTSDGVIRGTATYDSKTDAWTMNYYGTITQGQTFPCEIYYFENPTSSNLTTASLSALSAVYRDVQATYFYKDNAITIKSTLKPLLGRIRFKGKAGTYIYISGLKWYNAYSSPTNSLSQKSELLPLTFNSDGYTPYVYAQFDDASTRSLKLVDNYGSAFNKIFKNNTLAEGRSGFVSVPVDSSLNGWEISDEDLIGLCPDSHHPHAIELDAGLIFACCNLGARSPIDYGDYFSWGEIKPKSTYDLSSYKFFDNLSETITKYNSHDSVLEKSDDAANVYWGDGWYIPSIWEGGFYNSNHDEGLGRCSWTWTTIFGVSGYKITGASGKSIFLPAAGHIIGNELQGESFEGYYWLSLAFFSYGEALRFNNSRVWQHDELRERGLSVRPIYSR